LLFVLCIIQAIIPFEVWKMDNYNYWFSVIRDDRFEDQVRLYVKEYPKLVTVRSKSNDLAFQMAVSVNTSNVSKLYY